MLHQRRLFADSEGVRELFIADISCIWFCVRYVCVNVCFPFRGS